MTTVEARNLTLNYGDTLAVDGVSFSLPEDGIYGLLGRNASGKTSLLSVLAGFRKATSGDVLIDGEPVFENARATRKVCLIREGGDTVEGSETIECALEFAEEMRPHWDGDYAARLLDRFQLSDQKKVGQLSRGQRAALACTLGLASRAPVTMFDEAYLGLDAPSRYVFYDELLRDFIDHPRTVFVSTHLIEEVSALFSDVLIIDQGRLVLHDDAEAFRSRGVTVVGPVAAVDAFLEGLTVLSEKQLGPTKSAVVYGELGPEHEGRARRDGLELGPLPLQDLFVHLTTSERSVS